MDNDLEARIRTRAYRIWANDPAPGDNAENHWEEARRQIEAEGADVQDGPQSGVDQSANREQGDRPVSPELQDMPDADAGAAEGATR